MSILNYVLGRTPSNWESSSYVYDLYHEIPIQGQEMDTVLEKFPDDLKAQVTSVCRVQNPFMWGRHTLRKEQLGAEGKLLGEVAYYHPIRSMDKTTVMKYNLDCRRYSKTNNGQNFIPRKPKLYSHPEEARRSLHECDMLVVLNVLKERYDRVLDFIMRQVNVMESGSFITKDYDTDYYPEYLVQF